MNAERLLDHYERVADAPDAIPRLRRFILDLAVRGNVVSPDPNDEPASELLKRIAVERARLVKAGHFREPSSFVEINRAALPFIPASHWGWARLIDISRPSYGFAFPSALFNSEKRGMPLIRIRDISNNDTEAYFEGAYDPAYLVTAGDYLVGMDGDFNLRRWDGPDALLNQRVMRINNWRRELNPEFLKLPLQFVLDHLHGETSLTTVKHLSAKQVNGIELPIPPIAEQHRIVAKVHELMALCDGLERARVEREATRDRLMAAGLARLNTPDPETFQDDARFALDALPSLTARPDQIKQLRQTILNLAVRGKLVPQDPIDEPVPVRQHQKNGDVDGRLNFEMPANWRWARVEDVASARLGKMLDKAKNKGLSYPYLRNTNVHWFNIRLDDLKTISLEGRELEEYRLEHGDVLICEGGHGIGRSAVWRGAQRDLVFQKALHRVRPGPHLDPGYFAQCCFVYFDAGIMQNYFTGVGIPHFTGKALAQLIFPLPPLAEQHRIVAKVDELMALCDRLEKSLAMGDDIRRRLLDALLVEALEPVEGDLEQAA